MPWDVKFSHGLYLPQLGWWLDAHFPQKRSFVSHAHSDHTATHDEILCSAGTAALMRARLDAKRIEHVLPFGQTEQLTADCGVTLHPAGHIFGSAQCLLEHGEHGSLLYTGDFKLRRGRSAEPCATPHAELVIMETTFGRPHYVFPPTAQVLNDIATFCHETIADDGVPVLFGYSLGKSQELLCSLEESQLPVMLHPQTHKLTRVYEQFGIAFPPYREFDLATVRGHVVICPPQSRESAFVRRIPGHRTAMITGWAMDPGAIYRYQCDAAFPLSDHADYQDLLRFVEAVNPQRVLTLHGFATEFAQTLRERGLEAWAIGEDNQLELGIRSSPPQVRAGDATPSSRSSGDAGVAAPACATPLHAPDSFARFVAAADAVKATPKKLEKIAVLRDYLAALTPPDMGTAATFLTGRAFPQRDPRNLTLGWSVIKRAVLEVAGVTEADYRDAYHRFADTGDAAGAVLAQRSLRPGDATPSSRPEILGVAGVADPGPAASRPAATSAPTTCSLADMALFFERAAAARGPAAKLDLLRERLALITPDEARYLIKIITGDLRIGLKEGLVEEALAAAAGQPLEAVREAAMLCGDIAAVARAARTDTLAEIQLTVFNPLQFMLASPEPTAEAIVDRFAAQRTAEAAAIVAGVGDPGPGSSSPATADAAPALARIWLEEKYDGIRCQLHKSGGRVELYSRDLNVITEQFPDLARAALALPHDFIGDGELLAWRDGRALPFAELQKRLGRKGGDDFFLGAEIPVSISFYDLLWLDGRSLLKEPLRERRALLERLLHGDATPSSRPDGDEGVAAPALQPATLNPQLSTKFSLAPVTFAHTASDIEAAFLAARQRGNEGLMAKDPASGYTPGRRGLAWLKLKKAYATLDVVVVGVEYGHGKRRDVLSDYTFAIRDEEHDNQLLTVGKAYSGLTDVEIAQLTQHFLEHTLEVHGRYRVVVPDTVIEVAFDTIQPSSRHQSGFALRFPRIARIRTDKTPAEIDTLATCRKLAAAAGSGGIAAVGARPPPAASD
ncbi:ATP-dependent DNA ligase [Opitutus terrae]|uniref:Probable DNA ligase n=1 Tax=Opitutus terrae (strain DSM 11246 / JCM 15787 / PB90-1) TaxID=452637 RepID=DNLI_OPITP|nr:ATP-dependent DNA ligase [Opitutus terrae]B1ZZL9.1 RecName: Full=Probable DNA ligase; AltName: Full=Polydeoxyribonucleotide synthase [ATP] [Opitutus terrae PB90-1]ACB76428.1 DNA ligase I, ATP-dependent Dnl1 [Opitutus terrae PB90-1]